MIKYTRLFLIWSPQVTSLKSVSKTFSVLVLLIFLAIGFSCKKPEVKVGGPYYYESFSNYEIPFKPIKETSLERAKKLTAYYEAHFNEQGSIKKFIKYLNGKIEFSVTYDYRPDGTLEIGRGKNSNGKIFFQHSNWFEYEPRLVALSGVIRLENRFGPPGYGEDPVQDSKVEIRVLELESPINVKGDPADDINTETVLGVKNIQLVVEEPIRKYLQKKVTIKGTLFHGHTGHHYTEVLLDVQSINIIGN